MAFTGSERERRRPRVPNQMLTSRWIGCPLLFGVALVALIGCNSPSTGIPPEQPEATTPPIDHAMATRVEQVRRSLEQGLDVNKADPAGRTALMMAALEGYTEVVEVLLESGAEVERHDNAGRTALMYASSGPFPQTVELLIKNGANVNRADTAELWTALMMAAAEGHQPVVELLLRYGADIAATDQDGDSAMDHARERKQTDIVAFLESWPGGP